MAFLPDVMTSLSRVLVVDRADQDRLTVFRVCREHDELVGVGGDSEAGVTRVSSSKAIHRWPDALTMRCPGWKTAKFQVEV